MRARSRKLVGAVALLVLIVIYVWVASAIGAGRITLAPAWSQFAFFLVAGLLWVIPAAFLIKWMQRPD